MSGETDAEERGPWEMTWTEKLAHTIKFRQITERRVVKELFLFHSDDAFAREEGFHRAWTKHGGENDPPPGALVAIMEYSWHVHGDAVSHKEALDRARDMLHQDLAEWMRMEKWLMERVEAEQWLWSSGV